MPIESPAAVPRAIVPARTIAARSTDALSRYFWWILSGLLLAVAVRNHLQLNHDAIAYLQVARHWLEGRSEFAVNGYWGPLLSWLMVPCLAVGIPPLIAGRGVMAVSALLFVWGCERVLNQAELSPNLRQWGRWICGLNAVHWSVRTITPDLLGAGLFLLGFTTWVSGLRSTSAPIRINQAAAAGFLLAFAFLAKAVFLPMSILSCLIACILVPAPLGTVGGHALWSKAVVLMAAGLAASLLIIPWGITVSAHYGRPVLTTSVRINRAVTRPPVVRRPNPSMVTFHDPRPGRITSWEDPTEMDYEDWSPWASASNVWHQIRVVAVAFPQVLFAFVKFDSCGVTLLLALRAFARFRWPSTVQHATAWSLLMPIPVIAAIYSPFPWVNENHRFFQVILVPLFLAAASGANLSHGQSRNLWTLAARSMPALLLASAASWLIVALTVLPRIAPAGTIAAELALRMQRASFHGPVAGSGTKRGGRIGLLTSFHLGTVWKGDELNATPERWRQSGAHFAIVLRGSPEAELLCREPGFRNSDNELNADGFLTRTGIQVFEIPTTERGKQ
ncbi:MAG: hypothetical protein EXS36_05050 [Pedosphaera sp.]|nr:hypothetical protein [Pedosphaera sp.]